MKLQVRHAGGELTVSSQKEFLQLYNRRILADDDEVFRSGQWMRIGDLPWIAGARQQKRSDNKRLVWIVVALMVAGLAFVLWLQAHAGTVARKSGALPPGAVRVVPHHSPP